MNANQEYHNILSDVFFNGEAVPASRGQEFGCREIFARDMNMFFDLRKGMPVVSTKKVHLKSVIHELVWFLSGDVNIKYLDDNKVTIWHQNAYDYFKKNYDPEKKVDYDTFIENVRNEVIIEKDGKYKLTKNGTWKQYLTPVYRFGDLGPVYGIQFRNLHQTSSQRISTSTDQIRKIINQILNYPDSRRIILSAWNVVDIEEMALPPCHSVPLQLRCIPGVQDGKEVMFLDAFMYQRSADLFLGVPFNITSTALLVHIIAKLTGVVPRYFTHQLGSAHIYENHYEGVIEQLNRSTTQYPSYFDFNITDDFNIESPKFECLSIKDYCSYPRIAGKMVV